MLRAFVKVILGIVVALVVIVVAGNTFFPERMAQFAATAEREAAGLERKEMDAGRFHIVYLDGGQGEPLVLLHGFGADKDHWTRVSKYLTPRYRVIAPDLPGFGESSKPEDAHYSFEDQVEYLHAIVQGLGLKNASFGGNSMGGCVAALYAAKYPEEVQSLWLVAPACVSTAQLSELGQILKTGSGNPLLVRSAQDFDNTIGFVMTEPPYIPGSIKKVLARRAAENYPLHARIFDELLTDEGAALEPHVKGLATPTRILWGDRDRALNADGARILGGLMLNASVTILPGVGHLPMLEKPSVSADDYIAFRSSVK